MENQQTASNQVSHAAVRNKNGLYNQLLIDSLLCQQQQLSSANQQTPILASNTEHSWNDPQIHLASAASRSIVPFYDICDFVPNSIKEEVVIGSNGDQQIVVKSGPKRPLLENLTLSQWSIANMAILYKLIGDGKRQGTSLLDYLSHTTKIYQLVQTFSLPSVLLYDREYKKVTIQYGF